jgi:hypothetical protein
MKWSCLVYHSLVVNGKKKSHPIPPSSSISLDILHHLDVYFFTSGKIKYDFRKIKP